MSTTRRNVLKIMGGGSVAAATGTGVFLGTRTPRKALQPWASAGAQLGDPRLEILSWAILAPNPHNRQPWIVRLDGRHGFTLFADAGRRLPHTDPYDRQITIGLGCFLEVAKIAASQLGFTLHIRPFPEGESAAKLGQRPVASVLLELTDAAADPLFEFIAARRSCKEPFDLERPVTAEQLSELLALSDSRVLISGTNDAGDVADLQVLGWRAHLVETETPRTYNESIELMRIGKAEIEENPDGIDLGGPLLDSLRLLGLLNREQLEDRASSAYQQGLDMYRAMFANTPAFIWLSTRDNSRTAQLSAGGSWLRLNLTTTRAGLALHPISQALQEYKEMAPLYDEVHDALGASGPNGRQRVQMFARLGYGPATAPSPRWPLQTRISS